MGTKWTWKFASIAMGLIALRVEWMCSVSAVELSRSRLLTDNTTVSVSNLSVNISNQGCNKDKVCFSKPKNCNPAEDASCFFLSIRVATTNNGTFELFGKSSDCIGAGLLLNKTEDMVAVFACPNKNGSLVVNYTTLSNSTLTQNNSDSANASLIQCVFTMNGLKAAWDLMNQTYDVFLILGSFTNGSLGSKQYQTDLQKLVNEPISSTPLSNTTSMAITSSSGNVHPSNTSAMMSNTTTISANVTNVSSSQATSQSMGSNALHHIANKVTLILCSAIVSVLL